MKMSNKAQFLINKKFVTAIMVVVLLVLLIVLYSRIGITSTDIADREKCRASVRAYASINSMPGGGAMADESKIDCPTKYLTIQTDENKQVRRDVADLMVECWDNFGRGELDLFTSPGVVDVSGEKFCVLCSVFEFEDGFTRLDALPSFLLVENSPIMEDGKKVTYYEFFFGEAPSMDLIHSASSKDLTYLDGSKRYAILFTNYRDYFSENDVAKAYDMTALMIDKMASSTPEFTDLFLMSSARSYSGKLERYGGIRLAANENWVSNIIILEYTGDRLTDLGCESLPIRDIDAKFS